MKKDKSEIKYYKTTLLRIDYNSYYLIIYFKGWWQSMLVVVTSGFSLLFCIQWQSRKLGVEVDGVGPAATFTQPNSEEMGLPWTYIW